MWGDDEEPFWIDGMTRPERIADAPSALRYAVNPDYLKLMHIPLLRGRFFTDADNEHSSRVIVVDESFAQRYFGEQNPIGKHVYFPPESTGRRAHGRNRRRGRARQAVWPGAGRVQQHRSRIL